MNKDRTGILLSKIICCPGMIFMTMGEHNCINRHSFRNMFCNFSRKPAWINEQDMIMILKHIAVFAE